MWVFELDRVNLTRYKKLIMKNLIFSVILLVSCNPPQRVENSASMSPQQEWDANQKVEELGISLPEPSTPVANYVNAVKVGNLMFLAGKGPGKPDGGYITGKVGLDLTVEEGYEAARLTGIAQLAVLKAELGDLNKVKRIVKVKGMVNCTPDFGNQPEVINGYSDLMVAVFGDKGKHARAAVGMGSLPRGIAVEVEMVVEVE